MTKHCAGILFWLDDGEPDMFKPHPSSRFGLADVEQGKLYLSGALHCGGMKIETPVMDFPDGVVPHVRGFTISIPSFMYLGFAAIFLWKTIHAP
jgi:hypothetical protein